jgi:hypothetical protein
MYKDKKINIIGFNFNSLDRYIPSKVCVIHYGTPLISKRDEPGTLWCPLCGSRYKVEDTTTEESVKGKFKGPNQKTRIITAKKKRKFYDKKGNIITDPTLIQDILQGATALEYHEEKSGEDKPHVVRK